MGILSKTARKPPAGERLTVVLPSDLYQAYVQHCQALGISLDEGVQALIAHELQPVDPGVRARSRRARYQVFWAGLIQRLGRDRQPLPQNWFSFPLGQAGITADLVFSRDGTLRICCVIHRAERAWNTQVFAALSADRAAIEAEWGAPLKWEPRPGHVACRICDSIPADLSQESEWPRWQTWAQDRLERMERVFGPRLGAVVATADTAPGGPES